MSILVLIGALSLGCHGTSVPLPDDIKEVVITLERTACFGNCPVYKLTIYGDGRVVYDGKKFVRIEGTITTVISEKEVKKLVNEFRNVDYFSFKDSYEDWNVTDMPSAITSIIINGKTKTVSHYHGDFNAPEKLTKLERKIDEIVGSDQWTK
jgi:hypothetical protein